jgi:SPP1 family predicted phage head-tail adaptor
MIAERLNKRITIKQQPTTQDNYGETITDVNLWPTFLTVWASVEPINGKEFFAAEQVNASVSTRIRIRYLTGVKPAMAVLYGTRIYNIISVIDYQEQHKEMQLMCEEVI